MPGLKDWEDLELNDFNCHHHHLHHFIEWQLCVGLQAESFLSINFHNNPQRRLA